MLAQDEMVGSASGARPAQEPTQAPGAKRQGGRGRSHLTTCMRSERREMNEENQNHQREHSPEDADQQPEVKPAQLKQSVPVPRRAGDRRPPSWVRLCVVIWHLGDRLQ